MCKFTKGTIPKDITCIENRERHLPHHDTIEELEPEQINKERKK